MNPRENPSNDPTTPTTPEARRKHDQAAFRAGAPYILFPAYSTAFMLLATTRHWIRLSLALTVALVVAWMILVGCVVAYGVCRIRKYKRDHPFPE